VLGVRILSLILNFLRLRILRWNLTKDSRLDSFAPCYSQSSLVLKILQKKIHETRKLESTHEKHFVEQKKLGLENQTKTGV
jgi:hypothetical protein